MPMSANNLLRSMFSILVNIYTMLKVTQVVIDGVIKTSLSDIHNL